MSAGIIEIDRIIMYIPKAIPRLRVEWVWHNRIRLDEVVKVGRIETRLIVHQSAHAGVQVALTGVAVVRLGDGGAEVCPLAAEYPFGAQVVGIVVAILRCRWHWSQPYHYRGTSDRGILYISAHH